MSDSTDDAEDAAYRLPPEAWHDDPKHAAWLKRQKPMTPALKKAIKEADAACPSCQGAMRMYSAVPGSDISEPCPHRVHPTIRTVARKAVETHGHTMCCECSDKWHDPRCIEGAK